MTLIVSVSRPESIWMLADRRLTYRNAIRQPRDDARKIMFLETIDGQAILGYAGLGATSLGTEPADWMSAVLRGRNIPLEPSLATLAEAGQRQMPPHLASLSGGGMAAHNIIVPAFLGDRNMQYTIDFLRGPNGDQHCQISRHILGGSIESLKIARPIRLAGSGRDYLAARAKQWVRPLLRLVKAYDRGLISSLIVADEFARLNYSTHEGIADKSVGPECIVAWRNRRGGTHNGGGGQQYYIGTKRELSSPGLPSIGNGTDTAAIGKSFMDLLLPRMGELSEAMRAGKSPTWPGMDDELSASLAQISSEPDEELK
jgi:hypothetical protein